VIRKVNYSTKEEKRKKKQNLEVLVSWGGGGGREVVNQFFSPQKLRTTFIHTTRERQAGWKAHMGEGNKISSKSKKYA